MDSSDPKDSQTFIRSLSRGLAVIESMGGEPSGLSLSEVAARTDLDRATARRILLTLVDLRYVRMENSRFFLAPRVLSLGYAYLSSVPLWEAAKPIMSRLVNEVHESCSAATLDGPHAVYVIRIRSSERIVDVSRTVGSRIPAYCTSLGRVLLAAQPPEMQHALLLQAPIKRNTQYTVVDVDALLETLVRVRDQGFALVDQELELGLRSLAVPVRDSSSEVVAAINISVQAGRVSVAELKKRFLLPLQEAAKEVSRTYAARQRD